MISVMFSRKPSGRGDVTEKMSGLKMDTRWQNWE